MAINSNMFGSKEGAEYFDWSTFLITILLVTVGLISVYSATYIYTTAYDSGMSETFVRQLFAGGLGIALMIVITYLPGRWISANAWIVYGISIILLVLVLFIGKETYGTQGWIRLGSLSIQPSELAKIGVIMALAKHVSRKGADLKTIRDIGISLGIVLLPLVLIMAQPDVGSALVLIAILMGILFWCGFDSFILYFIICTPIIVITGLVGPVWLTVTLLVLSAIAFLFRRKIVFTVIAIGIFVVVGYSAPVIYNNLMDHQKARINAFLNPDSDPRGKGYNVIQSKMAVGSGGVTGKGFMQGTQTQLRYIPKQWTDFIFSVPTEEFGFIGGSLVILLLGSLIWRSLRIAWEADSEFSGVVAIGVTSLLFYHSLINIGMAMGMMPVMGIPLPFLSAGGTNLIVNLVLVGLLMNIYRSKMANR